MMHRDTIVVGASAGGVEALRILFGGLPADFPARVLVVLHVPPSGVNALASVLARSSAMRVKGATNRDRLEPGVVLVARPDHHLVVVDDECLLTRGPRENGHRPAIDVLFRSAADALGPRTIGVILSGALDDGSDGLRAIRARGGIGVVQDPDDAQHSGMPNSAIRAAAPEYVLPVDAMPALLMKLIGAEVSDPSNGVAAPIETPDQEQSAAKLIRMEVAMSEMTPESFHTARRPGESSGLSCPDCHGVLFAISEQDFLRFRCRVGHAWSIESLLAEHRAAVEGALWMALRALEEKAALCSEMSERATGSGANISARRFAEQATETMGAAEVIRRLLADGTGQQNWQEDAELGRG
jgi:two-component system, chemotaxis family, protein-glutamate methylesterase/glutaminase